MIGTKVNNLVIIIDLGRKEYLTRNGRVQKVHRVWSANDAFNVYTDARLTIIEHNGKKLPIKKWGEITGIKTETIRRRIEKYGWDIESALTTKAD